MVDDDVPPTGDVDVVVRLITTGDADLTAEDDEVTLVPMTGVGDPDLTAEDVLVTLDPRVFGFAAVAELEVAVVVVVVVRIVFTTGEAERTADAPAVVVVGVVVETRTMGAGDVARAAAVAVVLLLLTPYMLLPAVVPAADTELALERVGSCPNGLPVPASGRQPDCICRYIQKHFMACAASAFVPCAPATTSVHQAAVK